MKRKCFYVILFLIFTVFFMGCAETKLDTVRNPELSRIKFENILVVVPFTDIGLRRQSENAFISHFASADMRAISSLQLIPPIKDYDEQELWNILNQNRIDGILVVALKNYWISQSYVPKSSSTYGSARLYGGSLHYQSYTKEYGGYYISKPNVSFETRLFDRESGQVAWLVTSTTRGNAFADYGNLANSLAKKVVKELIKEDMLVLSPTDVKGTTASSKEEIILTEDINRSPFVSFTANPRTGEAPLEVFFNASDSYDPDGYIKSYQWDFKDGNTGVGMEISHTFTSKGIYRVELTIIDNVGDRASTNKIVIVK